MFSCFETLRLIAGNCTLEKPVDRILCGVKDRFEIMRLEPDDSFAAEAAAAKPFEYLTRVFQFNRGTDASSDRAVSEHARNLVRPSRR